MTLKSRKIRLIILLLKVVYIQNVIIFLIKFDMFRAIKTGFNFQTINYF